MTTGSKVSGKPEVTTDAMLERRELFRIAGQRALDLSRGGRDLSPEARADAVRWAAFPPLGRPLSTGQASRAAGSGEPT